MSDTAVWPSDRPTISWGAVIAGVITAMAVQIALAEACIGAGLAVYAPFDPASDGSSTAIGTAIALVVCALAGLFLGGWVAGRLAHYHSTTTAALHGILVWATGAVLTVILLAATAGMLAGGAISLVGDGLNAAARGAQAIGPAVAQVAAPTWDAMRQQVEQASQRAAANGQAAETRLADQTRMMDLFGKSFSVDRKETLTPPEREELIGLLASQLGISREAATKTIDQWNTSWNAAVARYEGAMADAERRAKDAAVAAKKFTAGAAGVGFLLMLAGSVAAAFGGISGSSRFRKAEHHLRDERTLHGKGTAPSAPSYG
jgi:hypothetical protein